MITRARHAGRTSRIERNQKTRARPTPLWLMQQTDLDEMARRRCVMVLRVLSGELAVTDAITEAGISRGTYYNLETAALKAMLSALAPGAPTEITAAADGAKRKIVELEQKVKKLEQERRRGERLLLLTRKLVKPGPMRTSAGKKPSSTKTGSSASKSSKSTRAPSATKSAGSSIHRTAGADEPSAGIEN